jgi:hypothetical protein
MKKALVLLLIVAFIGVAVFADDAAAPAAPAPKLSLSGRVETGIQVNGTASGVTLQLKDSKDSGNALDTQINASYGDGATWGLNMGLGFSNSTGVTATSVYVDGTPPTVTTSVGSLYLNDANVWFKPISQLKFTVGKNSFGDYGTLENGDGWGEPDTTGLQIGVYPVDGLSIGLYLPVNIAAADIVNSFENLSFGAKYSLAKVFAVTAEYFLNASSTGQFNVATPATGSTGEFLASASLDAVENLTVQAGVDLQLWSGASTIIAENVAYNFGILKPQVYAKETISAAGTAIYLDPQISFTIVKDIFNPWIGFGITLPATGAMSWSLGVNNTFTVGNNGIQVAFDLNGGTATTWDVKLSYDLNWSN